jgi:hypothetical protein
MDSVTFGAVFIGVLTQRRDRGMDQRIDQRFKRAVQLNCTFTSVDSVTFGAPFPFRYYTDRSE